MKISRQNLKRLIENFLNEKEEENSDESSDLEELDLPIVDSNNKKIAKADVTIKDKKLKIVVKKGEDPEQVYDADNPETWKVTQGLLANLYNSGSREIVKKLADMIIDGGSKAFVDNVTRYNIHNLNLVSDLTKSVT